MKTSGLLFAAAAGVLQLSPVAGQRHVRGVGACELAGTWVPVGVLYRINSIHGKPPFVSYGKQYTLTLEHEGETTMLSGNNTIISHSQVSQALIGFHDPHDCGFRLVSTTSSTTYVGRLQ